MSARYTVNGELVQNRAWLCLKFMKIKSMHKARFVIIFLRRYVTHNKFETNEKRNVQTIWSNDLLVYIRTFSGNIL